MSDEAIQETAVCNACGWEGEAAHDICPACGQDELNYFTIPSDLHGQ